MISSLLNYRKWALICPSDFLMLISKDYADYALLHHEKMEVGTGKSGILAESFCFLSPDDFLVFFFAFGWVVGCMHLL